MKLQYHKIRGVDKSVCTAEQKIAYNMASRIYGDIRFAKVWQQYDSGKVPAFLQNDWESKAIRTYFTTWQRDYNKLRMYMRSFTITVMAMALKSLPSAAQCGKPKPTAKLTLKMNISAP